MLVPWLLWAMTAEVFWLTMLARKDSFRGWVSSLSLDQVATRWSGRDFLMGGDEAGASLFFLSLAFLTLSISSSLLKP